MPDASELIATARFLLSAGTATPAEAQLRRAVSTAYYALFHRVSRAAAERFIGKASEASAAYALLYRGFNHGRMRDICKALDAPRLKDAWKKHLGRDAVSQDARDFTAVFGGLQEARRAADYDPRIAFSPSDVASLIEAADNALAAFDRIAPGERADILALMLVGVRG